MIYSTYILVHPRTQQLQNVLTLEDYHQVQALLEYCLQRQQQDVYDQNREHARLAQALYNNKLLQLDYRRQRAAQIQRLMQREQQLDQFDRARVLAALEKQRAQQCFRRFIQHHYQPQAQHEPSQQPARIQRETPVETQQAPVHRQTQQAPVETQQAAVYRQESPAETQQAPVIHRQTQQTQQAPAQIKPPVEQQVPVQQDDDDDDEQVDDAYEQYQTRQLEDLLKHIFEKNTHQQEEEEYVPRQQDDPEDEQTMADLLPILKDEQKETTPPILKDERKETTPPIPPKSMEQQQQPIEDSAFVPDTVLPLQDVVDDLVRIPTPAVQPPKPPVKKPIKDQDTKERRDKLEKLAEIEQTLDRLAKEADGTAQLPLQYQVNDQGGLFLDGNTPNNHTFLMFEDEIIRCMLQLDQILSDGDPVVRDRRRAIVKKAEQLLEPLDQHKQAEWKKETRKQQLTLGEGKKKKHHRRHGKRRARVPVTA